VQAKITAWLATPLKKSTPEAFAGLGRGSWFSSQHPEA